jgi:hypothetical protein
LGRFPLKGLASRRRQVGREKRRARVLAGELGQGGPVEQAFARYEALLHPFIERKQNAAVRFAGSFAPRTRFGLMARNLATCALRWTWFAAHAIGPSLRDDLAIPDCPQLSRVRGRAARRLGRGSGAEEIVCAQRDLLRA